MPILQHLRFPFSIFLLPVFLLALAHEGAPLREAFPLFVILHLLVYPSSNGFNSLQDRDEGSIGGIEHPTEVPPSMRWVTLAMDLLAVTLVYALYDGPTGLMVLVYIVVSRLYSIRSIRLKQYPIIGYLVVVLFQGAWVFLLVHRALNGSFDLTASLFFGALVASSLIGASYPLTQIYQHDQDRRDGVTTISYLLGIRGTIGFAAVTFGIFMAALMIYGRLHFQTLWLLPLALAVTGPAAFYLLQWARRVWKDPDQANFRSAMRMSVIGSLCMNLLFGCLVLSKFYHLL